MTAVLVFALALLVAVLISELAHRSILSTAVLFLLVGGVLGARGAGLLEVRPDGPVVARLAELALVAVLFTDGMRAGIRDLLSAWRLPGRALLLGFPLTLVGTALLARVLVGLSWGESLLVGAALAPTDPVFAAAIVGREEVPGRIRRLLNVESGLNDGLALPVVLVLLEVVGAGDQEPVRLAAELLGGIALGVAVPWVVLRLERLPVFAVSERYAALLAFAIGLVVWALASTLHVNPFLGAFAAGVTVQSVNPDARRAFRTFGEPVTELLKLAALLLFGALIGPSFLSDIGVGGVVLAVLLLVAVRPAAIGLALLGSGLTAKERVSAAWFGPRGFASVVYGLLVLRSGLDRGPEVFHLIAVAVALSIVAHSSTDVLVARWFRRDGNEEPPDAGDRGSDGLEEAEQP